MSIAIIGTGWGARVQVPAFRSAGLTVSALAGRDPERTAAIAGQLGVEMASGNWQDLLARDEIRLISIVTPPDRHAEMAIAALEAGKHVLCEKPTAMDARQAEQMLASAQAHPAQLALIDHELRFLPALGHARALITSGAIGQVRHILVTVITNSRANPERPWNWWSDAAQGGGLLGAIGSHQIDTLRYLLADEVQAVAATLNTFIRERPAEQGARPVSSDDYFSLRLRMAGGALASIECSLVTRLGAPDGIMIYGDGGTLRLSDGQLFHAPVDGTLTEITPPHAYALPAGLSGPFPHGTVYLGHAIAAFLNHDDPTIRATGASFVDGLQIQRVLDAARRSDVEGGGYQRIS